VERGLAISPHISWCLLSPVRSSVISEQKMRLSRRSRQLSAAPMCYSRWLPWKNDACARYTGHHQSAVGCRRLQSNSEAI